MRGINFLLIASVFSCSSKISETFASKAEKASKAASKLTWVESSPQEQTRITATWTPSKLTNQKLQFYSDATCAKTSGEVITLSSASLSTYSFDGEKGNTYTFKIISSDDSGKDVISDCSDAMFINSSAASNTTNPTTGNSGTVTTPSATTITAISDKSTDMGAMTDAIGFTLSSPDTALTCTSAFLSLSSANPSIVLNSSVVWGGYYPFCTAMMTPQPSITGTVSLTITVTDSQGRSANTEFDLVVKPDFVLGRKFRSTLGDPSAGVNGPASVFVAGGKLFVADSYNNRVLVWNSVPTTDNQAPDFALGQPNLTGAKPNNGGLASASSLSYPFAVFSDGTKLFVADSGNNRVLVWNSLPTSFAAPADYALGQPNLHSSVENNGGVSGASMSFPSGIFIIGTKLFVADANNNRLLGWNTIPSTSGTTASFALGQPNLTSNSDNNGGLSGSSMSYPTGVYSVGTTLFVTDGNNCRVLVWNTIPTTSGQSANFVLGQPNMTTVSFPGVLATSLNLPTGVFGSGTKLFVVDQTHSRILVWNTLPSTNGEAASFAIGQVNLTSNSASSTVVTASRTRYPMGVFTDGTKVFVADHANNRILIWNSMPAASGVAADRVLGQSSLTLGMKENGGPTASSLSGLIGSTFSDGTRLFVADTNFNRVLIWNSLPTYSHQPADVVLGQPNFTSMTANNGGISSSRMFFPYGIFVVGTKLFVADKNNSRVLVWNTIPTVNGQAASFVLGQANFTSNSSGAASATTMSGPVSIYSDGTKLFVSDQGYNRVLVWNSIPTATGQAADFALGQPNLTSNTNNNGGVSGSSMYFPTTLTGCGTKLFAIDYQNLRVLGWNTIPTVSGQSASFALGQPDLTQNSANNGGISASTLNWGGGIHCTGTKFYLSDNGNNRVLIWNSLPTTTGEAADAILGQPDFATAADYGEYRMPYHLAITASKLYAVVTDAQGQGALIVTPEP